MVFKDNLNHKKLDKDNRAVIAGLFLKMTEFALEHSLTMIGYMAVANHTKQQIVNITSPMSCLLLSRSSVISQLLIVFFKRAWQQSKGQLQFRKK